MINQLQITVYIYFHTQRKFYNCTQTNNKLNDYKYKTNLSEGCTWTIQVMHVISTDAYFTLAIKEGNNTKDCPKY